MSQRSDQPPYVREMLLSQGNLYALLGSVAAGVLLSIPFGFGVGAIPVIAFAAGEAIAALYVPRLPSFRERVNRRYRNKTREDTRSHLIEEIEKRVGPDGYLYGSLQAYGRMVERVAALYKVAEDNRTQLSLQDAQRLDDATVDYLSMWLAALVIDDRFQAVNGADIERRIEGIEREIKAAKPGTDPRQLRKARDEYLSLLARHRRMGSRKRAIEAALLSMPDQMEEIYQTIMTAPVSSETGSKLEESIAKLRIEEEIEAELAGDLRDTVPELSARLQARPAAANRAMASQYEGR